MSFFVYQISKFLVYQKFTKIFFRNIKISFLLTTPPHILSFKNSCLSEKFLINCNCQQHGQVAGNVVKWLKCRARDQHGLSSKPTHAILLCPWERYFMAHSPAWWS